MKLSGHILVVSDQGSMRDFLEDIFRREGHRATSVTDMSGAMLCLETDDVDVLITDMEAVETAGPSLLEASRSISPDTIVIATSELANTEEAIDTFEQGPYDYISKPLNVNEIKVVVEKALEKKRF